MRRLQRPAFKSAVDDSLKAMIRSGEMARTCDKCFMQPIPPANANVGLPVSEATNGLGEPNDKPVEEDAEK